MEENSDLHLTSPYPEVFLPRLFRLISKVSALDPFSLRFIASITTRCLPILNPVH